MFTSYYFAESWFTAEYWPPGIVVVTDEPGYQVVLVGSALHASLEGTEDWWLLTVSPDAEVELMDCSQTFVLIGMMDDEYDLAADTQDRFVLAGSSEMFEIVGGGIR